MPSFFIWILNWYCSCAGGKGNFHLSRSRTMYLILEASRENKREHLCMNLIILAQKWWQWISVSSLLLLIVISVSWWSTEYLITKCLHRHVLQSLPCHSCTVLCSEVLWRPLGSLSVETFAEESWRQLSSSKGEFKIIFIHKRNWSFGSLLQ